MRPARGRASYPCAAAGAGADLSAQHRLAADPVPAGALRGAGLPRLRADHQGHLCAAAERAAAGQVLYGHS